MERSDITNLNDIPFAPPSRSPIMPNGNVEGDNIRMNIDPQMMSKVVHDLEKPSAPALLAISQEFSYAIVGPGP